MSSRKRLSFKEKAMILEESSKPNFDKRKICKDFGISKSLIYMILKEKQSILTMKWPGHLSNLNVDRKYTSFAFKFHIIVFY